MFKSLGLNRNPFSADYDEYLHVAGREAVSARIRAITLIESGRDLWVRGPAGAGRESFVAALANILSKTHPVVFPSPSDRGRSILTALHSVVAGGEVPEELLDLAEVVYKGLLDGFWQAVPIICVPSPDSLTPGDVDELEIIAGLSFLGRKLALTIACGEGDAPLASMETVDLAAPTADGISEMLRARLALCGGAGLLEAEIPAIAENASGYAPALRRAAEALNRVRYLGALSPCEVRQAPEPRPIFAPESLSEVSRLFEELSADAPEL